jgi:FAD/FMN-containing dehydrogenase
MTTIDFETAPSAIHPPAASDEFVLDLRLRSARSATFSVRPRAGREVAVAVRYARDEGQDVHVDLSAMKRVVIDPRLRIARVQPGVTTVELERAAAQFGLAPLVDGQTLVLANLIAANVVLPDGELVAAGEELLREIRTGRARGIVVDATYRLHSAAELRR